MLSDPELNMKTTFRFFIRPKLLWKNSFFAKKMLIFHHELEKYALLKGLSFVLLCTYRNKVNVDNDGAFESVHWVQISEVPKLFRNWYTIVNFRDYWLWLFSYNFEYLAHIISDFHFSSSTSWQKRDGIFRKTYNHALGGSTLPTTIEMFLIIHRFKGLWFLLHVANKSIF